MVFFCVWRFARVVGNEARFAKIEDEIPLRRNSYLSNRQIVFSERLYTIARITIKPFSVSVMKVEQQ